MRISLFYFLFFSATGVLLPWFSPWLKARGFDGGEMAFVSAIPFAVMIAIPPVWGWAADRTGRTVRILQICALGATVGLAPILGARTVWAVALAIFLHALFHTAISGLVDVVAVDAAGKLGSSFGRLRSWGSVGFLVASLLFGLYLEQGGSLEALMPVALGAMVAYSLVALSFAPGAPPIKPPRLADVRALLGRREVTLFLVAGGIHWAALSPFHLLLGVHFGDLGVRPGLLGLAMVAAVAPEVGVLWSFGRLAARFRVGSLLAVAFLVSAARWALTGLAEDGAVLVLLQLLHGFSFGVFFGAAIEHLHRQVAPELLASARALFGAVVFGLGGVLGHALAGPLYDLGGGRLAFLAAGALELLAPLILLLAFTHPPGRRPEPRGAGGSPDEEPG